MAIINYDEPLTLEEALKFRGRPHTPVDYIDVKYEEDEQGNIYFKLHNESNGFGSRSAGEPVRKKLLNLSRLGKGGKIIVDFSSVPLVSSSYADEVFGKIFIEFGPIQFGSTFEFKNIDPLVRQLVERAITQRLSQ